MRVMQSLRLLPLLILSSALFAQEARETREESVPLPAQRYQSGDGKGAGTSLNSMLTLEAGDADSKATISLVKFKPGITNTIRYKLEASAPFDRKKASSVDIGTLSGLTAGSSMATEFSWVNWPANDSPRGICEEIVAAVVDGYDLDVVNAFGGWRCVAGKVDEASLKAAVQALNKLKELCGQPADAAGTPHPEICRKMATYSGTGTVKPTPSPTFYADKDALLKRVTQVEVTALSMLTIGAKLNRQSFSFVLPGAPTEVLKDQKHGWSASLSFARMSYGLLWSVGYSRERAHAGADKVQICSPIGTTGSTSCAEASLGAPTSTEKGLAFGEARFVFDNARFALSPRVEFDTEGSEWAARVPLYLVRSKEGALTAGFAIGYSSKDDDVGISVFVGKPFTYLD
jgi:hypothetical protein